MLLGTKLVAQAHISHRFSISWPLFPPLSTELEMYSRLRVPRSSLLRTVHHPLLCPTPLGVQVMNMSGSWLLAHCEKTRGGRWSAVTEILLLFIALCLAAILTHYAAIESIKRLIRLYEREQSIITELFVCPNRGPKGQKFAEPGDCRQNSSKIFQPQFKSGMSQDSSQQAQITIRGLPAFVAVPCRVYLISCLK